MRTSRGREADGGHARAGREAEALGLRAGVADHERGGHRRGREDRAERGSRRRAQPQHDAEVDDALAPAVEDRVHERAELRRLAGRPGERAVEQVEDAAEDDEEAGEDPALEARGDGREDRDPEADQRQGVRREADLAHRERDRRRRCRGRGCGGSARRRSRGGLLAVGGAGDAEDGGLARARTPRRPPGGGGRRSRGRSGGSSTRPAARSRPTCHETSGCDRPTWATSSATVASASARRRTIRSRLTSARALWTSRSSRRSFGWTTTDASVDRMRAGDGDRVVILAAAVASTTVYINGG